MGANRSNRTYAWSAHQRFGDGRPQPYLLLECANCSNAIEQKDPYHKPAEMAAKWFCERDWVLDMHRKTSVRCPQCTARKNNNITTRPAALVPAASEKPMNAMQSAPAAIPATPLTSAQRDKIRDLLDEKFDTDRGCYKEGCSDQVIARQVNVGFAHVASIREVAYGPIKADPEISAALKRIEDLKAELTGVLEKVGGIEQQLNASKAKVEALQKRFAP